MTIVYLLLLLVAAICFLLDVRPGHTFSRVNLLALGLLLWVLVPLIQTLRQVL